MDNVLEHKTIIPRNMYWEEALEPLVRRITGVQQGKTHAGCDFENDIFKMKVHFFGNCECDYAIKRKEYEANHSHKSNCFHVAWQEVHDAFINHPKYHKALILKTERLNMEMQICRQYNVKYCGEKISKVCTCDFEKNWSSLNITHDENCPCVTPNFWYKPKDFKIWWYKTFFRKSYSNYMIDQKQFQNIIKECMKSLKG